MARPIGYLSLVFMMVCCLQLTELSAFGQNYQQILFDSGILLLFTVIPLWVWVFWEYNAERLINSPWLLLLLLEPVVVISLYIADMFFTGNALSQHKPDAILLNAKQRLGVFFIWHRSYMIGVGTIVLFGSVYIIWLKTRHHLKELLLIGFCLSAPMLLLLAYGTGLLSIRLGAPALTFFILWGTRQYHLLNVTPVALNKIINTIKTGVIVVNAQQKLVYANQFSARLLGFEQALKDLNQKPLPTVPVLHEYFDFSLNKSQQFSIQLDTKPTCFVDVSIEPLFKYNHQCFGHAIILQDVTARQNAELTLAQQAEQLSEFNRQKSDFFAGISHEFRTPLTLSLGYLNSLIKGEHGTHLNDLQGALSISCRQNERLLSLVNQLLDLSQLDSGAVKIRPNTIALAQYLPALMSVYDLQAAQQGVEIKWQCEYDTAEIYFDVDAFEKIVHNLLSNALKSMSQGGLLTVAIKDLQQHWQLNISDTGCGITERVLPYIFEPFFYRDNHHHAWSRGTGVGLSLVKQLLGLHQASIDVSSTVGEGSCFTVLIKKGHQHFTEDIVSKAIFKDNTLLTLNKDSNELAVQAATNRPEQKTTKTVLPERLILVVEDNAEMRRYIRFQLGAEYRLVEAVDGQEGLELAEQLLPDLVLSDVMMPIMSGLDLCAHLKSNIRTSHIPVLLLTAKSSQAHKLEGLKQGADEYLVKPFDVQELQLRINNLIQSRIDLKRAYSGHWKQNLIEDIPLPKTETKFLDTLQEYITQHISEAVIPVQDLSSLVNMSERTLSRKLKALTGETPNQLLQSVRLSYAAKLLVSGDLSITEISYAAGFSGASYFTRKFKEAFSQTPKKYRESHQLSDLCHEMSD